MQGNGGTHNDEPELYSGSRCNTIYVDSTASSQLGATGHGSECESPLLIEKVEKKARDQDPQPTDTLSYDKVENWLQFTCSANGLHLCLLIFQNHQTQITMILLHCLIVWSLQEPLWKEERKEEEQQIGGVGEEK